MLSEPGPPAPSGVPGRHVITVKPSFTRFSPFVMLFFALVLGFIGTIWTVLFRFGAMPTFPGVLGLVMLVVAAGLVVVTMVLRLPGMAERISGWSHPTLEIAPWPLDLGTRATVVYRRRPRRRRTLSVPEHLPRVTCTLTCTEWVRYRVGTDTRTETHRVVEQATTVTAQPAGEEILATFQISVPVDAGGPTLRLTNNRVTWSIQHELGEPYDRRTRTVTDVVVRPVLDRDIATGERSIGSVSS